MVNTKLNKHRYNYSFNLLYVGRRMSLRASILNRVCSHRRHLRLENLRTLMLADNCMNRIQLSTDDDGFSSVSNDSADELDDWVLKLIIFCQHYYY